MYNVHIPVPVSRPPLSLSHTQTQFSTVDILAKRDLICRRCTLSITSSKTYLIKHINLNINIPVRLEPMSTQRIFKGTICQIVKLKP